MRLNLINRLLRSLLNFMTGVLMTFMMLYM